MPDDESEILPSSTRDGEDEEAQERQSPPAPSRDGGGQRGAINYQAADGHKPSHLDEIPAGEGDAKKTEPRVEVKQPLPTDGNTSSTRTVAEASSSPPMEGNNVGVEGDDNDDRIGLLDEAPEKCHVG